MKEHDREGRVIAIQYPSVTVLALYVPNNGSKAESFQRRYMITCDLTRTRPS